MSLWCSSACPLPPELSENHFPHITEPSVRFNQRFSRRSHLAHFQPLESHRGVVSTAGVHGLIRKLIHEKPECLRLGVTGNSRWSDRTGASHFSPQNMKATLPEQQDHSVPCLPPRGGAAPPSSSTMAFFTSEN